MSSLDRAPQYRIPWRLYLVLLLVALAAGFALRWFWGNFDRAERSVRGNPSVAARRNAWLGLEQFLQRGGVSVSHLGLDQLWQNELPPNLTLISRSAHLSLDAQHQEQLRRWLAAGGHLIVPLAPQLEEDGSEPLRGLLSEWQIRIERADREEDFEPWSFSLDPVQEMADSDTTALPEPDTGGVDIDAADAALRAALLAEVRELQEPLTGTMIDDAGEDIPAVVAAEDEWSDEDEEYDADEVLVYFDDRYYLSSASDETPLFSVTGYDGEHILSYALGAGRVSVLSSGGALENGQIEDYDHAWFFYRFSGAWEGRPLWFVDDAARQGLLAWLWAQAWPLWSSLGICLVLAIWRANLRWGPALPTPTTQRRHLGEHLSASADFLWRHKQLPALWEAALTQVLQRWAQEHPQLPDWPRERQLYWIAEHGALTVAQQQLFLHCLLAAPSRLRAREFLQLAQVLQALRRVPLPAANPVQGSEPRHQAIQIAETEDADVQHSAAGPQPPATRGRAGHSDR